MERTSRIILRCMQEHQCHKWSSVKKSVLTTRKIEHVSTHLFSTLVTESFDKSYGMADSLITKAEQPRITFLRRITVGVLLIFVVSLGLPLYFTTTTIYRAELPIEEISEFASGLQEKLHFNIPVYLDLGLGTEQINGLQNSFNSKLYQEYPELQNFWSLDFAKYQGDIDSAVDYIVRGPQLQQQQQGEADQKYLVSLYSKETTLYTKYNQDELVSILLEGIFHEEITSFVKLIRNNSHEDGTHAVALPYSSNYNVVFSLFSESGQPIDWEISKVSKLFKPIFQKLNHIANFTISSQIQYYSSLTIQPTFNQEKSVYEIQQDDLSTFINFGDWNLITHEITPTINFIVYFGESNYRGKKLKIAQSKTNSFLVPQWGGVYVFNKDKPILKDHTTKIVEAELMPVMETFVLQLLQLIGMPSAPKSLAVRIDSLSRLTTFKNLRQSLENLMSLVKLTEALNEISIPELTKESVETTLTSIKDSITQVNDFGDFELSVKHSSTSVEYSNRAFFEKEMVQQAYFPQEHKLAVFLPLIGPILSILLLGVIKTVKDIKGDKKKRE